MQTNVWGQKAESSDCLGQSGAVGVWESRRERGYKEG